MNGPNTIRSPFKNGCPSPVCGQVWIERIVPTYGQVFTLPLLRSYRIRHPHHHHHRVGHCLCLFSLQSRNKYQLTYNEHNIGYVRWRRKSAFFQFLGKCICFLQCWTVACTLSKWTSKQFTLHYLSSSERCLMGLLLQLHTLFSRSIEDDPSPPTRRSFDISRPCRCDFHPSLRSWGRCPHGGWLLHNKGLRKVDQQLKEIRCRKIRLIPLSWVT